MFAADDDDKVELVGVSTSVDKVELIGVSTSVFAVGVWKIA